MKEFFDRILKTAACLAALAVFCHCSPSAAQPSALFQSEIFVDGSDTLPFRLLVPPASAQPPGILLWLHGKGERGNDNKKQLVNGVEIIADSVLQARYNVIIIAPQCPVSRTWSEYDKTAARIKQQAVPSRTTEMLLHLLADIRQRYQVDSSRIYIAGISMGGFGTWDIITRYPGLFAAAIAICGGGDPAKALSLKNLPVRAFHGEKDKLVLPHFSVDIMNELLSLQPAGTSSLTIYPGVGHNAWDYAFKEPGLLRWMFSQKKR